MVDNIIRFDSEAFVSSMEYGIVSYVVKRFEDKLADKLNGIVDEVYKDLREELPDQLKANIMQAFSPMDLQHNIRVEVDLSGKKPEVGIHGSD